MSSALDGGVKTVEQARALPEIRSAFWEFRRETDPKTGITTEHRVPMPFTPRPIQGDEILLFTDTDGRSMQVIWTKDGPAKTPWNI